MTGLALVRRRVIEHNALSIHLAQQLMAVSARNILVRSLERECGPAVVVEFHRLPARHIVTTRTIAYISPRCKLTRVWIYMASGALHGSGVKIGIAQCRFQIGRTMAVGAGHSAMRAEQREVRLGVIKLT